jgi:hypothetical protein
MTGFDGISGISLPDPVVPAFRFLFDP